MVTGGRVEKRRKKITGGLSYLNEKLFDPAVKCPWYANQRGVRKSRPPTGKHHAWKIKKAVTNPPDPKQKTRKSQGRNAEKVTGRKKAGPQRAG